MNRTKSYKLITHRRLLTAPATFGGRQDGRFRTQLLVDTGANYTILPVEAIDKLGYDLSQPVRKEKLTSASGVFFAPVITLRWFNCLGQTLKNFPVVAHTFPTALLADGLLGMDFLTGCGAVIAVADGTISFNPSSKNRGVM
ncbi:MAG: retropepsin-like aspartic protease [Blastocatellia bacterium]